MEYCEYFFITAFTLEFIIHVVANGFIYGRDTYLRNPWNWIDFIVVVTSLLSLHPSLGNISFL